MARQYQILCVMARHRSQHVSNYSVSAGPHRNMFVRASAITRRLVVESQAASAWATCAYGAA